MIRQASQITLLINFAINFVILLLLFLKGNAQFIFLCKPQKSSVKVCLLKILKQHCHKKSICVFFYNLGEENFSKLQLL